MRRQTDAPLPGKDAGSAPARSAAREPGAPEVLRRAAAAPRRPLRPAEVLALQRAVGNRAVQRILAPAPVVQRAIQWRNQTDKDLDGFVGALDTLVEKCANEILDDPLSLPPYDNYIKRWQEVYLAYQADGGHPFLYTAYGYAVESLASFYIEQGALDGDRPPNTTLSLQATRGATRPDLVLKHQGQDMGWFDITASNSVHHVAGKAGAGWDNTAYVAEILYDSLDPLQLGRKGKTIAEGVKARSAVKRQREAFTGTLTYLAKHFASWEKEVGGNRTENRKLLETRLGELFGLDEKMAPATAKSMLAYVSDWLGADYFSTFGYTGASRNGRDKEAADELLYNASF